MPGTPLPAPHPWSIFSDGGGSGVAWTWADDLLGLIGAPLTRANEQFVYDWEVSEGGGGRDNPLNQGPVPGHPELTSTGPQYGGGAADFVSWKAGLTGAADYLSMPAYAGIRNALRNNDPVAARTDLILSPWASSHYDGGAGFSDAPLPGQKSALPKQKATASSSGSSSGSGFEWWSPITWFKAPSSPIADAEKFALHYGAISVAVLLGVGLVGVGIWRATGAGQKVQSVIQTAAPLAAVA